MDGEHVFSATIVLVMVCASFPTNAVNAAAMNAGLNLLREMGQRGNSQMAARFSLLWAVVNRESGAVPIPSRTFESSQPSGSDAAPNRFMPPSHDHLADSHSRSVTVPSGVGNRYHGGILITPGYENEAGTEGADAAETLTFPMLDNRALGEPFFDESTNTAMDFGLWEEGFADPAMDASFTFTQWTESTGTGQTTSPWQ
jgi:proline utilization trans-activator